MTDDPGPGPDDADRPAGGPAGAPDGGPGGAEGPAGEAEGGRRTRGDRRERKKPLSEVLSAIAADATRQEVAVGDLLVLLGGRGRAALILLFALPNVLPTPPGTSGILGLPLLYLSFQMMLGRVPWLPRLIDERSMPRHRFAQLVDRVVVLLGRAERLLRPRWSLLVGHGAERVLGALCLVLAVVLVLPIPLGNILPALAICLIALGGLERDGLWVVIGILVALLSLVLVAGVVYALVKSTLFIMMNAFA